MDHQLDPYMFAYVFEVLNTSLVQKAAFPLSLLNRKLLLLASYTDRSA